MRFLAFDIVDEIAKAKTITTNADNPTDNSNFYKPTSFS